MSSQIAYRLGDGAPVPLEAARAFWVAVAREVLEENPRTASITQTELARQVQQRSGVYTRKPAAEWLPAVLDELDDADLVARLRVDAPRATAGTSTGGTRTRAPRPPRAAPAARKREEVPPAICPTCFMQLPASGRCDTCS
jgi:hypothetical protein